VWTLILEAAPVSVGAASAPVSDPDAAVSEGLAGAPVVGVVGFVAGVLEANEK
jgi:hypothetical protein